MQDTLLILQCVCQKFTAVLVILVPTEKTRTLLLWQIIVRNFAYKTVSLIDSSLAWLDLISYSVFMSNWLHTLNILIKKEGYRFSLSLVCINCTLIDKEENIPHSACIWGNNQLWAASGLSDLETSNKTHKNQMLKNSIRDSFGKRMINHLTSP